MIEKDKFEVELKFAIYRNKNQALSEPIDPSVFPWGQLTTSVAALLRKYEPVQFEVQYDQYYNHPQIDLIKTDRVLRQRSITLYQKKNHHWRLIRKQNKLTYKGPADLAAGVKSREEIELSLPKKLLKIFVRLDFIPSLTIQKHRWFINVGDFSISVDVVKTLGVFIEIEKLVGINDQRTTVDEIETFLKQHGLTQLKREARSYAALIKGNQ